MARGCSGDPRASPVQPLPPRSLPRPHSSLWALAPSSCPAQRAQSPAPAPPAPSPPRMDSWEARGSGASLHSLGPRAPGGRASPGPQPLPQTRTSWSSPSSPSHRAPSCPQASHLAPQAKVGPGGPKPPFLRGEHPASTGTGRGCVHSPEPPSQGPHLPPAPRACQWPPLSTPWLGPHQQVPILCPLCSALNWPQ